MADSGLTDQAYRKLAEVGRNQVDYWQTCRPKMWAEMRKNGTLLKTVREKDESLLEMQLDLIGQGIPLDVVSDMMWEEIRSLPPEKN